MGETPCHRSDDRNTVAVEVAKDACRHGAGDCDERAGDFRRKTVKQKHGYYDTRGNG